VNEHVPQRDPEADAVELIAVRAQNPGPMTLRGPHSCGPPGGAQV